MKRGAIALILVLLAGCQPGGALKVTRMPGGVVRFELNGDGSCLNSIRIAYADTYDEAGVMWSISQRDRSKDCLKLIDYPVAPKGFEVEATAKPLAPGRYWVTGKAEQFYLSGDLDIPSS